MNDRTFKHAGYRVIMHQDLDAESPSNDDEVFIVTTRNRYFQVDQDGFTMDAIRDGEHKRTHWVFPVFAYIHSGIALSTSEFSCPWDSGQIGHILCAKSSFKRSKRALEVAKGTLETWNQSLSGDVWGFEIEDEDGNHVDSCWGFYGLDYAITEAKEAAVNARASETRESSKIGAMCHT